MKKGLLFVLIILSSFMLVGCGEKKTDRLQILEELVDNDIIPKKFKEVDQEFYKQYIGEWCESRLTYIYKDGDGDLFGIQFKKGFGQNKYYVSVYKTVTENDFVDYYDEDEIPEKCNEQAYYDTEDDKPSKTPKYSLEGFESYTFTKDDDEYKLDK